MAPLAAALLRVPASRARDSHAWDRQKKTLKIGNNDNKNGNSKNNGKNKNVNLR
jgi:hypothetical protein